MMCAEVHSLNELFEIRQVLVTLLLFNDLHVATVDKKAISWTPAEVVTTNGEFCALRALLKLEENELSSSFYESLFEFWYLS